MSIYAGPKGPPAIMGAAAASSSLYGLLLYPFVVHPPAERSDKLLPMEWLGEIIVHAGYQALRQITLRSRPGEGDADGEDAPAAGERFEFIDRPRFYNIEQSKEQKTKCRRDIHLRCCYSGNANKRNRLTGEFVHDHLP